MTDRYDLVRLIEGAVDGIVWEMVVKSDIAETVVRSLQDEADTRQAGWLILPQGVFRVQTANDQGRPTDSHRLFEVWVDG